MSSKDSRQTLTAVAAVIIIALLGITAFLLYSNTQKNKDLTKTNVELDEVRKLKDDTDKLFLEAQQELEGLRSDNEEANQLIDEQQAELEAKKSEIGKLIRSGKANKRDLAAARSQLEDLQAQVGTYVTEINTLKEQNMQLTEQTVKLGEEKVALQTKVTEGETMNQTLVSEKAVLVSEKEDLENERSKLSKMVNIGSVIKVGNVHATGLKVKDSGKEKETSRAKSVTRLRLCFNTTTNDVVVPGDEKFFIRLINPIGETMAVESMGSGVMLNNKTNEEVRYTTTKDVDFNNQESMYCTNWDPGIELQKGTYEIQVYNKGYLCGQGSLALK